MGRTLTTLGRVIREGSEDRDSCQQEGMVGTNATGSRVWTNTLGCAFQTFALVFHLLISSVISCQEEQSRTPSCPECFSESRREQRVLRG